MKGPESKLKEQVKAYLDELDAYQFMPRPTEWGHNGVDFLVCCPVIIKPHHVGMRLGLFAAVETKIWPNKATPRQRLCLTAVQEAGGIGFVAYDMNAVRANLGVL